METKTNASVAFLDNFNNLSSGRAKRQKNSGMGY